MFSTKEMLIRRTGKNKVGRFEFLKLLRDEYKETSSKGLCDKLNDFTFPTEPFHRLSFFPLVSEKNLGIDDTEAKEQVLANLANFAYDPINYEFIRKLNIIDLLLDAIDDPNEKIAQFGIGGLCNLCLDRENKEYILGKRGVVTVAKCLFHPNEEIVISAISTLIFLITPASKPDITCPEIVECMVTHLRHPSKRITNLASAYLDLCCSKNQVAEATQKVDSKLGKIPVQGQEIIKSSEALS